MTVAKAAARPGARAKPATRPKRAPARKPKPPTPAQLIARKLAAERERVRMPTAEVAHYAGLRLADVERIEGGGRITTREIEAVAGALLHGGGRVNLEAVRALDVEAAIRPPPATDAKTARVDPSAEFTDWVAGDQLRAAAVEAAGRRRAAHEMTGMDVILTLSDDRGRVQASLNVSAALRALAERKTAPIRAPGV